MAGQQARGLLREQLPELADRGVGHLRDVRLGLTTLRVDHEQRRGVSDLSLLDRRLDRVLLPHSLELRQGAGQEVPRMQHPAKLGVGPHVLERGCGGIGVDPQQLHPRAGLTEHRLGIEHRAGRQRTYGRALGIVEREDHHLAAKRTQRHRLSELVRQREVRRDARNGCPWIQDRVERELLALRPGTTTYVSQPRRSGPSPLSRRAAPPPRPTTGG